MLQLLFDLEHTKLRTMDMDAGETTLTLVEGLKRKLMDATQDASNQVSLDPGYLRVSSYIFLSAI